MAISVGRLTHQRTARLEHVERYAVRLTAFLAYTGAVAIAFGLLGPALFRGSPSPAAPSAPPAVRTTTVQAGETLQLVAARNGISIGRLLALNPTLEPFFVEPGREVRVR